MIKTDPTTVLVLSLFTSHRRTTKDLVKREGAMRIRARVTKINDLLRKRSILEENFDKENWSVFSKEHAGFRCLTGDRTPCR